MKMMTIMLLELFSMKNDEQRADEFFRKIKNIGLLRAFVQDVSIHYYRRKLKLV